MVNCRKSNRTEGDCEWRSRAANNSMVQNITSSRGVKRALQEPEMAVGVLLTPGTQENYTV